jgi:xanthosine utilization system XapX-like protein
MGKVNVGRVILGGLVAGIIFDILGYLVDGLWLAPRWAAAMTALGHPDFSLHQWIYLNLLGLITGIVVVWVYAGFRPRYGAGPRTAILAGALVWVVGMFVPNLTFMWVSHLFSHHLTELTTAAALIEIIVGAIAGAALYRESAAT